MKSENKDKPLSTPIDDLVNSDAGILPKGSELPNIADDSPANVSDNSQSEFPPRAWLRWGSNWIEGHISSEIDQSEEPYLSLAEHEAIISNLKQEIAGGSWAYVKQIEELKHRLAVAEDECNQQNAPGADTES